MAQIKPISVELTPLEYLDRQIDLAGGPYAVAEKAGMNYQTVRRFLIRENDMTALKLAAFGETINVSLDFPDPVHAGLPSEESLT